MRNRLFVSDFLFDFYTVGGLLALLLPVLMGAGHGLGILISRKTDKVSAVLHWTKASSEWVE